MTDGVRDESPPTNAAAPEARPDVKPTEALDERAERHWAGYPGGPDVQSYGVPASARYGLLYAIIVFIAMMVAVAWMMGSAMQTR